MGIRTPSDPEVRVTIRLDDVIAPVHVGLKRSLELVDELLYRSPPAPKTPEAPRVFFSFDPAPGFKPSADELRSYVDQRILHWAISDSVELLNPLIVNVRAVCTMYDRGPSSSMTGDEWNAMQEEMKREGERMARLKRPVRISELLKRHPGLKMPPLLPEIDGIFQMRNCLVHNGGIVGPTYCNETGGLRIRFLGSHSRVIDPAGDHDYQVGERIREPQKFQLSIEPSERSWPLGGRIDLSHQLLVDLCVTIDRFAIQMAQSLEAYARLKGIPFETQGPKNTDDRSDRPAGPDSSS